MRILHVIRGLSNSSGTTHIVGPLAEAQARAGHRVGVLYVEKPDPPAVVPDPALVESYCYPMTLPFDNPGWSWPLARAMKTVAAGFDVVHVHAIWNFPTWWAMRAALQTGLPYMVAPQGALDPWALRQNRWGKKLYGALTEIPLMQRATWMQALSEKEAGQFRAFGLRTPVAIVPNGIDETVLPLEAPRLADRLGWPLGTRTLLFLSRLHPKKGLDILIPAFAALAQTRSDVCLAIAGHDAGSGYADKVDALIREYGLADRCRRLGELRGTEKYAALKGADAFVLPSYSEGLPVAAIEAMGAGVPVVLSDECNIPEAAEMGAGYVVRPSAEALTAALVRLFGQPEHLRAMGENGSRLVRDKFTWRRIAQSLVEIYASSPAAGG